MNVMKRAAIFKSIFVLFLTSSFLLPSGDISMHGIKINDPQKSLENVGLEQIAKEGNMQKFRTENGNDFSITVEKGKVVYLENDWLQNGQTSLKDIRAKFSTNGFTYKTRGSFRTKTHLILFNCFEFDSENKEVLVTITKVSLNQDITEKNIASKAKLDALIIADGKYLDKIWGKEKTFDAQYKKIQL
ncbi:MAG: hypothetical protein RL293_584 [Bacteroidota bacterium]